MATNRSEMLPEHLLAFSKLAESKGWVQEPFEHDYEVFRAKKGKEVMSIYQATRNRWFTVCGPSYYLWEEFKQQIKYPFPEDSKIARNDHNIASGKKSDSLIYKSLKES